MPVEALYFYAITITAAPLSTACGPTPAEPDQRCIVFERETEPMPEDVCADLLAADSTRWMKDYKANPSYAASGVTIRVRCLPKLEEA